MPLFFVFFIINFPAGVIVYWITTNTWTMAQQYVIRRGLGDERPPRCGDGRPGGIVSTAKRTGVGDERRSAWRSRQVSAGIAPRAAGAPMTATRATIVDRDGDPTDDRQAAPPPPPRKKKKRSGRRREMRRDRARPPRGVRGPDRARSSTRSASRPRSKSSRTTTASSGEFVGDDLGLLIGHHGQTIDAIQHLAYRIASRAMTERRR